MCTNMRNAGMFKPLTFLCVKPYFKKCVSVSDNELSSKDRPNFKQLSI